MTKQDEIREGMAEKAHLIWQRWMAYMLTNFRDEYIEKWKQQANTPYSDLSEQDKESDRAIADQYFEFLHSQGVVIKVDEGIDLDDEGLMGRVLPNIFDGSLSTYQYSVEKDKYLAIVKPIEDELKEAGFVAVEPLIKEVTSDAQPNPR